MTLQFSFIICAAPGNEERVKTIISSIESQNIPTEYYEIIIIGSQLDDPRVIKFNENIRPGWITRKKNLGAQNAKFDNLVFLHDYIVLEPNWYQGFCSWKKEWDLVVTPLTTLDGKRWRDFTIFPLYLIDRFPEFGDKSLLPYDYIVNRKSGYYVYASGGYYIVKRDIALRFPLDESRTWGGGEDLEWCRRLHAAGIFVECNSLSNAKIIKEIDEIPIWHKQISEEQVKILNDL